MRLATILLLAFVTTGRLGAVSRAEEGKPERFALPKQGPIEEASRNTEALARRLIEQCLSVRENELVQITGGSADVSLLEALAVHTRERGAHPLVTLLSADMIRRFVEQVPEKYDSQRQEFNVKVAEIVTAAISIDCTDWDLATARISPTRMHAQWESFKPVVETLTKRNVPCLILGNGLYPTAARAESYGMSQQQLAEIFWGGIDVDYAVLQKRGERVRQALEAGNAIHLKHPNGTDLDVRITKQPVYVSDGIVTSDKRTRGGIACQTFLPAGEVYFVPVPNSAEGRLIFGDVPFQGTPVRRLTLTFKDGRVTDMRADSGLERVKQLYDSAGGQGKDRLALIDLGINPNVRIEPGSKLIAPMAGGVVSVGIGGNDLLGGQNTTPFFFWGPLIGASLTVDGKTLIENGKLKP